jgi:glucose-1-phosphate cytidylyltransferase
MASVDGIKKAVILAGGLGSRLQEETSSIPKPMVTIGDRPILWHIMKIFEANGVKDFIICLGYKGYVIKEYFANYALHAADFTVNTRSQELTVHRPSLEDWNVTLVDTGEASMTGGRLARVADLVDEPVFVTYGDGLADVDLAAVAAFHRSHGKRATMTVVAPPGRYGAVEMQEGRVERFREKPAGDGGYINGGYFVLDPSVLQSIEGDGSVLEEDILPELAASNDLMAYQHHGFWQAMDTLRDRRQLEALWSTGDRPWATWAR